MATIFFNKALAIGRTPNIQKLFPNSKALIVSGKFINNAMVKKGKSACIAVNGRNIFIIKGALKAAQRANSALIVEIARSEGGANAYCAINYWNIARIVDTLCNELAISIPIAIHADHYSIENLMNIPAAIIEIPSLFEAGITSLAIDASHLPDDQNLLASIELNKLIPKWSGLETEIGEIKGKAGLSTQDEAIFMARGLNAHDIFPDWIALNNGTTHGIEYNSSEIRVKLTTQIHRAISKYGINGAQHGTSGNNRFKLKQIVTKTNTTKANIATTLQMLSWGVEVNVNGNAKIDENGNFIKIKGHGTTQKMWSKMIQYANEQGWIGSNYKKLNLPFENKLLGQPKKIRDRMSKDVEDFIYDLLVNVFNAEDTAQFALESIIESGSYCPKPNVEKTENPKNWTPEKISERVAALDTNKDSQGNLNY